MSYNKYFLTLLILAFNGTGCKKAMQITPPVGSLTTTQVFATDANAIAAVSDMYYNLANTNLTFSNSAMTICGGMNADELMAFDQTPASLYTPFQNDNLTAYNSTIKNNFWGSAYSVIYIANSIIAGLELSSGVHDSVKNELKGEAEFVRAFCNFYLVNLFGDIPLLNSTNWQKTGTLARTPVEKIYQAITEDLIDAQLLLARDYSVGKGQRIVPDRWTATALLARVYLYRGNWTDAEIQAATLINNTSLFTLTDLNAIFLCNSQESIWQLQQDNHGTSFNATPEGYKLLPRDTISPPLAWLSKELLGTFEPGDNRFYTWTKTVTYKGINYSIPYKYRIGASQATPNGPYSEYYMVFRLAEQYLIRSEARAELGESNAIDDLNMIRNRAHLPAYTGPLDKTSLLAAIFHERQVELFSEWGHRWLDLKRTNQAGIILEPIKPGWTPHAVLYPIPNSELITDPNLTQNIGY